MIMVNTLKLFMRFDGLVKLPFIALMILELDELPDLDADMDAMFNFDDAGRVANMKRLF